MLHHTNFSRLAAIAVLLGSLTAASPVFAHDAETKMPHHMTAEDMQKHVDQHIATLHDKLKITADQEAAWMPVADAMRANEKDMAAMISERNQASETRTAVEDLESYQKIAQSHADAMQRIIAAFTPLYNSMPDDQKKNADVVFGAFEGHRHSEHHHKDAKAPVTK